MLQGWMVVLTTLTYIGAAVCHRVLWRSPGPHARAGSAQSQSLCPVACSLLHQLDLFRLGGPCPDKWPRFSDHLHRPDDRLHARRPRSSGASSSCQSPSASPRSPIFWVPAMARTNRSRRSPTRDRGGRDDALYCAPAESGGDIGRHSDGAPELLLPLRSDPGSCRHRLFCRHRHGGLCHSVRHAPCRRNRASGRADPRSGNRKRHQADRLPDRRGLRDLLDVRWPHGSIHAGG